MTPAKRPDGTNKRSTGKRAYAPRRRPPVEPVVELVAEPVVVAKPARKPRARRVTVPQLPVEPVTIAAAVDVLEVGRRSTTAERRAVLLAAMRQAAELAEDRSMPPTVRAQALTIVRGLTRELSDQDAGSTEAAGSWLDGSRPVAL